MRLGGQEAFMTDQPERDQKLVDIFDTKQESEALVVRGLLESAGIESMITYLDAPQDVLPGVGGIIIRVRPEQAESARRIIAEFQTDAQVEIESQEEPPG